MKYVLDASVAVAALRNQEDRHADALRRCLPFFAGNDEIVVPAIFDVEVVSALVRRGVASASVERLFQKHFASRPARNPPAEGGARRAADCQYYAAARRGRAVRVDRCARRPAARHAGHRGPAARRFRLSGSGSVVGRSSSRAKTVERNERLALRDDGALRLAVVADTHSSPHPGTMKHIETLCPDAILHAGDIGDLVVLDALAAIAPLHAVRGNIDVRAPGLADLLTIDVMRGDASVLRILLLHIAVDGPRLRADAARLAHARDASLVVCGHSHVPLVARDRGVAVFNPGSAGPRRFHLPILFGTIDVTPDAVRLAHFDCETGLAWKSS